MVAGTPCECRVCNGIFVPTPSKVRNSDRRCSACKTEQSRLGKRAWDVKNRDRENARKAAWRKAHPEIMREHQKRWLEKNHEYFRQWLSRNREKFNAYMRAYRARKKAGK